MTDKRVTMPLSEGDREALDGLQDAGALYENYLAVAQVARIPSLQEQEAEVGTTHGGPLTLVIRSPLRPAWMTRRSR